MVAGQKKGQLLTHCKKGHEFTEDNIIYRKRNRGRGEEISRICRKCHRAASIRYRKNMSLEKKQLNNSKVREWRKVNKVYVRNARLKYSFGITLDEYNKILISQNNKCLICGKEQNEINLVVDHDHDTGEIRGLLCSRCNRSLGWYEKCKQGIKTYLKE